MQLSSPTSTMKLGALLNHLLPHMPTGDLNTAEVQAVQTTALGSVSELLTLVCVEQSQCFRKSHPAPVLAVCVFYPPHPRHSPKPRCLTPAERHPTYTPSERTSPFNGIRSTRLNLHFPLLKDSLLV